MALNSLPFSYVKTVTTVNCSLMLAQAGSTRAGVQLRMRPLPARLSCRRDSQSKLHACPDLVHACNAVCSRCASTHRSALLPH